MHSRMTSSKDFKSLLGAILDIGKVKVSVSLYC
jgi:hypothetical protein